jgi:autotransporter-associated beta strand protein
MREDKEMGALGNARGRSRIALSLAAAAAVGAMALTPDAAHAANGIWSGTSGGLWGDTNNWSGGIVAADGGTASFNALDLSGDLTVTLDAPRTLSTLTVVDTTLSSGGRYVFTDAGIPANSLALSGAVTVTSGGISVGGTAVMSAAALNISAATSSSTPRPTFSIDGGSFTASGTSTISGLNTGSSGQFILNSGSATFNGTLRTSNNENVIIKIAGGTFSAADLDVQRNSAGSISFSSGIIVTGGTSTVGTVQLGSNNSNGAMSIEGGSFTANGAITIARQATSGRGGAMRVTNGTFTSTDAVDGIILSRQDEGGNANQVAAATFSGGVSTVEKFTLGYDANVNAGSATLTVNGGALYVGSGGIVRNGTGTFTSTVSLTSGTLGARTDWSSSVAMSLPSANSITIKAADAVDAAHNISLNGVLSGAGGFTKTGAGTLTLGGANTYSGTATVSEGTLAGTTTSLRGSITNNSNVTFNQSTDGAFTGTIGGSGSVTTTGAGALTLAPQTYTGATTLAGGSLVISGANTATSGVTVQSGTTLALGGSASVNALTLGTAPGDAQTLLVNTGSGVNGLNVLGTNALVANGNTTIDVGSLGLTAGVVTLLDYDGTIGGTGGGFGAFHLGALPPRVSASLVDNAGNTSIDLNVTSIGDSPRWTGAVNGNWDIGTISPATGTQNWKELNSGNTTVYLESSVPGDRVLFDDSATGTTSINIVSPVNPTLVTVNNTTKNYTFSGAKIGGPAPLLKQGTGSLTLSNAGNDYTGGTSIQGGTVILGVANALPTAGDVTLAGGTLDLGGLSQDLSGAFVLNSGTIANGTVNKSGANYDLRAGSVSANLAGAVGITKTTASTVTLLGASTFTGATAIQNGTVQLGVANALPTGTAVTLGSGSDSGVLNLNGFSQQVGSIATSGTGTANALTNSSATGATFAVNLTTGTQTFGGALSGNLTFEKQGAGTLNLTGVSTYTGGTNLNGGILSFTGGALGSAGSIAFTSNSTLRWATGNTEDISPRLAALPSGVVATFDTNAQNVTLGGTIAGPGGITKAGAGALTLAGANTYAGGTILTAGNIRASNNSALGTGSVTINGGSLQLDNGVTISNNVLSNSTGDNMLDVPSGNATYAGIFTASSGNQLRAAATGGGTLNFTGSAPLGTGIFVLNAGNIVLSGSGSITGGQALLGRPASEAFMSLTLRDNASMSISGITNIGNGREVPDPTVTIQDNASYSTGTTFELLQTTALFSTSTINLNGGTLTAGSFIKSSNGAQQLAVINFNGGTLRPSASSAAFLPALTGLTAQVLNGAVIDTNGFDATVAAALVGVGSGGLTKNGAGTLTLSGANTYTGGTTVNAGTLSFAKQVSLYNNTPASWTDTNITVNPGATLALAVGGASEFTAGDVDTIKALGSATGGFKGGSKLGLNTATADFAYGSTIANPNAGANALGLVKLGGNTLTLTAANTYTGGTTVSAGTLVLGNADATAGGAIAVANGALAQAQAGLPKAVTVATLATNTSGKFDLTNNSMVVKGMTSTQVRSLIVPAYNAGAWNGPTGLTSSTAAAGTSTGVGYADNAVLGLTSFKGVDVGPADVLVKYTYYGDADLDGDVDGNDVGRWATNFTGSGGSTTKSWVEGDWDYDGDVDGNDVGRWAVNFTGSGGGMLNIPNAQPEAVAMLEAMGFTVVPEPTGLALLGAAGAGLLARRRRSK